MSEPNDETNPDCLRGPEGRALLLAGRSRHLSAGAVLCREGEPTDHLYVVTRGTVAISRTLASRDLVLSSAEPGCILALMPALDGQPCTVTLRAEQECTVVEIARTAVFALLQPDTASAPGLSHDLALLTARRLRDATSELAQVLSRTLRASSRSGSMDALDLARIQAGNHRWRCAALAA